MRTTLFFLFLTLIHFHNTLNKEGIWMSSFIYQKPKHKGKQKYNMLHLKENETQPFPQRRANCHDTTSSKLQMRVKAKPSIIEESTSNPWVVWVNAWVAWVAWVDAWVHVCVAWVTVWVVHSQSALNRISCSLSHVFHLLTCLQSNTLVTYIYTYIYKNIVILITFMVCHFVFITLMFLTRMIF